MHTGPEKFKITPYFNFRAFLPCKLIDFQIFAIIALYTVQCKSYKICTPLYIVWFIYW